MAVTPAWGGSAALQRMRRAWLGVSAAAPPWPSAASIVPACLLCLTGSACTSISTRWLLCCFDVRGLDLMAHTAACLAR